MAPADCVAWFYLATRKNSSPGLRWKASKPRRHNTASHLCVESSEPFRLPAILASLPPKWRYRIAPAMAKEFFDAHFHPADYSMEETPDEQSELRSLRAGLPRLSAPPTGIGRPRCVCEYAGDLTSDGNCILIFPEGKRTDPVRFSRSSPALECWCPPANSRCPRFFWPSGNIRMQLAVRCEVSRVSQRIAAPDPVGGAERRGRPARRERNSDCSSGVSSMNNQPDENERRRTPLPWPGRCGKRHFGGSEARMAGTSKWL